MGDSRLKRVAALAGVSPRTARRWRDAGDPRWEQAAAQLQKEQPPVEVIQMEPARQLTALEQSYLACLSGVQAEAAKEMPDFELIIKGAQALARVGVEKRKERLAMEQADSARRQTERAREILYAAQTRAKGMLVSMPRRLSALLAHKDEEEIEQVLTADLEHFMRALQDGIARAAPLSPGVQVS